MLAEQGSQAGLESRVQVPESARQAERVAQETERVLESQAQASPDQQAEQAVQELESQGSQEPGLESAALVAQAEQARLAGSVQESEPGSQGTEWAQAEPDPPQS